MPFKPYTGKGLIEKPEVEICADGTIILMRGFMQKIDAHNPKRQDWWRSKADNMQLLVDDEMHEIALSFKSYAENSIETLEDQDIRYVVLPNLFNDFRWLKPGIYSAKRTKGVQWKLTFSRPSKNMKLLTDGLDRTDAVWENE